MVTEMAGQKTLGVLFGVAAGGMWAIETILGKLMLSSLSFLQVTASEAFFATVTAFAFILLRRENVRIKNASFRDIVSVGLMGTVLAPLVYFYGLTQTLAVNAALIAHLQPLFVSILGSFFLRERIHKNDILGGVLVGSSVIMITGRTIENIVNLKLGNIGDVVVLLATLLWAFTAIPGKRLTRYESSVLIVGYRFLVASFIFLPVLFLLNQLAIKSIFQVLLGITVGLGYVFYYEGLKRIKASQVAITELSSPFFVAVLAWFLLGEHTTMIQIIGAFLLTIGLATLTMEKTSRSNNV